MESYLRMTDRKDNGASLFSCHIKDFKRYSAFLLAHIGCGFVGGVWDSNNFS